MPPLPGMACCNESITTSGTSESRQASAGSMSRYEPCRIGLGICPSRNARALTSVVALMAIGVV